MSNARPRNGAPTATITTHHDGIGEATDQPTVSLRNEDSVAHTLEVRVVAGGHRLAGTSLTVESESQTTLQAAWSAGGPIRIELRADHGCSAAVSIDPATDAHAPAPEFIVRSSSVVVAGVVPA